MSHLKTAQAQALKGLKSVDKKVLRAAVKNMFNLKDGTNLGLDIDPTVTIQKSAYKAGSGATVNQGVLTKDGKQLPFGIHFENNELKVIGDFYGYTTDRETGKVIDYAESLGQTYTEMRAQKQLLKSNKYSNIKREVFQNKETKLYGTRLVAEIKAV